MKPIDKEHIQIGDVLFSTGKIITSAMRKADKIAIFTASVGKEFDEWCRKLKKDDDILGLFISDAVGSVLAESAVSYIIRHLEEEAVQNGLKITGNYSPGYCDRELPEQKSCFLFYKHKKLFKLNSLILSTQIPNQLITGSRLLLRLRLRCCGIC